eukprot:11704798-Karenia_brevis.AAC.1
MVKTQNLVETARRGNYKLECYYLRGLQHIANTTPTMEPQWWANCIEQGDQLKEWEGPIIIFTDGSGGERSNYPTLRRCGWS